MPYTGHRFPYLFRQQFFHPLLLLPVELHIVFDSAGGNQPVRKGAHEM